MEKLIKYCYSSIFHAGRWRAIPFYLLTFMIVSCSGLPFREAGPSGVYHRVKSGETLAAIAKAYHTDLQSLAEVNNIMDPSRMIEKDSVIFIPHAQAVIDEIEIISRAKTTKVKIAADEKNTLPGDTVAGTKEARKKSGAKQKGRAQVSGDILKEETIDPSRESGKGLPAAKTEEKDKLREPGGAAGKNEKQEQVRFNKNIFIWPVRGKVTSFFGVQPSGMFFNGIRIAAPEGTVVVAAGDGVVIHSASLKYYGETIIIQHADDYASVYANLGVRAAVLNKRVKKGDRIGFIGNAAGNGEAYLHFEIRNKNKARNPLFFLP